jgi:hypothetical protein
MMRQLTQDNSWILLRPPVRPQGRAKSDRSLPVVRLVRLPPRSPGAALPHLWGNRAQVQVAGGLDDGRQFWPVTVAPKS